MRIFLGSPGNQMQAHMASGCRVLSSFVTWQKFKGLSQFMPTFSEVLLDSGAFSEFTSKGAVKVELDEYVDWIDAHPYKVAWAGLDDINGDHERSLRNYQRGGFPTIHDKDPGGAFLDELVEISREQGGNWIGIGVTPTKQRHGMEAFIRDTIERIPDDLHIHGWALGLYTYLPLGSIDSTNWWRDSFKILNAYPFLTTPEALEIVIKRITRVPRMAIEDNQQLAFPTKEPTE